jgi:hypothetical protein
LLKAVVLGVVQLLSGVVAIVNLGVTFYYHGAWLGGGRPLPDGASILFVLSVGLRLNDRSKSPCNPNAIGIATPFCFHCLAYVL